MRSKARIDTEAHQMVIARVFGEHAAPITKQPRVLIQLQLQSATCMEALLRHIFPLPATTADRIWRQAALTKRRPEQ